jgi:diguanylate cyclase (GGDEF)-like protein
MIRRFNRLYQAFDHPSPVLIWSATAIGLLLQLIVFAVIALDTYRSAIKSSFEVAENIAALIEQDIARNIGLYDLSLQAVVIRMNDPEVMALPPRLKQMAVFDRSTTAPGLGAMVVLDKNGSIILDSLSVKPRPGNFFDREYFKFQRDTPNANGLYISLPFEARLQNLTWSISISRRLTAPDGSFAGIVSGTLKLDFIRERLESAALGKLGVASLFRDDGILLIQNNASNANIGADWNRAEVFKHAAEHDSGIYSSERSMDEVPRLFAFRRVSGFPLLVVAGIARDYALAPWWSKLQMFAIVFIAMAVSVIVLVAMFNRELRRRIAAERGQAALARQDRLSQLANRLGFDEALPLAWRRAGRERQPLSLLMIDVDKFKEFNDRYGHPEGDKVLTAIAAAIGAAARRPGDLAARYGGEEFVVLLPNTDSEGAMRIAEKIRGSVLAAAVPHEGSSYRVVTVSLGVATIVPNNGMAQATLVENADRALYAAKAGGRNKACLDEVAFISSKAPAASRAS